MGNANWVYAQRESQGGSTGAKSDMIRYVVFIVHLKAEISQLNLLHCTVNLKIMARN